MLRKETWSSIFRLSFSLSIVLLLAASPVWSQGFQGTIRGSVQDATGAQIPNATVTITNIGTGETRTQPSSETGTFNFPGLLVGTYSVSVELQGFKKLTQQNVQVSANSISDVLTRLEVGGVTEEVSVTAGPEIVQVSTAQLAGYTTRNVSEYPNTMLTGNPNNFAILAPGTTTMPGGMAGEGGSIGGNRPRNNNFVVDGVDNNDPSVTGAMSPVIAEAVEEFTLLTNQFSAEYGHSTAGQFITTTRSGTNELHGRAWLYNQNRHMNSLDNLTRAVTGPGAAKPRYDYNRFGGQFGGPILRDKWFYFTSYEYQNKNVAGTPSGEILVPTAAGLQALQALANSAGSGVSRTNVGLLASLVPTAPTQSQTTTVMNEATGTLVPIGLGQFSATTPQFDRTHLYLVNSDFQTGNHRVSGRYSYSRNPFVEAGDLPTEQFNSNASFNTHRITFGHVWTANARTVNEFRAGYNRGVNDWPVNLPAAPAGTDVFGNYAIIDQSLFIGPLSNFPQSRASHIYQFANNTSYLKGAHTLKFGAEVRNMISDGGFLPRARGEYQWNTLDQFVRDRFPITTSIRGVGVGTFVQNRTAYHAFAQDSWKVHPRVTLEYGLRYELTTIARDQNLQDLNGIANIVDVTAETFEIGYPGVAAGDPRIGRRIWDTLPAHHQQAIRDRVGQSLIFRTPKPDINNFSPRIGLSWDLTGDGKTSLRAGLGIATDVIYGNLALLQLPPQIQAENRETNACALSPSPAWCSVAGAAQNPRTADIRFSTSGFIAGGGLLPVLPPATRINKFTARTASGNFVTHNETSPETYTWTLSLQREQFSGWLFEGRYIGNHAVHLPMQVQKNAGVPNPVRLPLFMSEGEARSTNFSGRPTLAQFQGNVGRILAPYGFGGALTEFVADGQSWYHGGSVNVTRRMANRMELNANYTFSKTIDTIENDLNTSALNPRRPRDMYDLFSNKGLSGMHRAHKLVVSWLYEIPGINSGEGVAGKLLSGWRLNGIYIAESGQPVTVQSGRDVNGDGDAAGDTAYFNAGGQKDTGSDVNFVCWNGATSSIAADAAGCGGAASVVGYVPRNPSAMFIRGQSGMDANVGRGTVSIPGINTFNFSLMKKTPFWGEGRLIEFRAELFNAFNHPSYTLGKGSIENQTTPALTTQGYVLPGTTQFLDKNVISGGLGNAPFQRIVQLGMKVIF